jgi:hypothetical protein
MWSFGIVLDEVLVERALQALAGQDPDMLVWWGSQLECVSALTRIERAATLDAKAVSISAGSFVAGSRRSTTRGCFRRTRSPSALAAIRNARRAARRCRAQGRFRAGRYRRGLRSPHSSTPLADYGPAPPIAFQGSAGIACDNQVKRNEVLSDRLGGCDDILNRVCRDAGCAGLLHLATLGRSKADRGLAEGGAATASPGNSASSLVQLRLCRSF